MSAPKSITLGSDVFINAGCILHAEGGLYIGDGTKIGPYTSVWTSNHVFDRVDAPFRLQGDRYNAVRIERDVWLGANVVVLAGVTIGESSVVGAGSIVTKDIPSFSVAAGNPAKVIRSRIDDAN